MQTEMVAGRVMLHFAWKNPLGAAVFRRSAPLCETRGVDSAAVVGDAGKTAGTTGAIGRVLYTDRDYRQIDESVRRLDATLARLQSSPWLRETGQYQQFLDAARALRQAGAETQLPVKSRPRDPVRIQATLLLVRRGGKVLLHRRSNSAGRMPGFWELPSPEDLPSAQTRRYP